MRAATILVCLGLTGQAAGASPAPSICERAERELFACDAEEERRIAFCRGGTDEAPVLVYRSRGGRAPEGGTELLGANGAANEANAYSGPWPKADVQPAQRQYVHVSFSVPAGDVLLGYTVFDEPVAGGGRAIGIRGGGAPPLACTRTAGDLRPVADLLPVTRDPVPGGVDG